MKCISCDIEIPSQWVHAINSNICPNCGKEIMDSFSQDLIKELREVFEKMNASPEALAGWLIDNYTLKKVGSAEPVEFKVPKIKTKHKSSEDEDETFVKPKVKLDKSIYNDVFESSNEDLPDVISEDDDLDNLEKEDRLQSQEESVFVRRAGVDMDKVKRAIAKMKGEDSDDGMDPEVKRLMGVAKKNNKSTNSFRRT